MIENNDLKEKIYLINFIDNCSRYTESIAIKNIEAKTVIKAMRRRWLENHGTPKRIICDHGKQFTNRKFIGLCKRMKIEICYSTINNPQGNSLVERIHRTINEILRIHKSGKSRKEIERIIFRRLNLPVHRSIGYRHLLYSRNGSSDLMLNYQIMKAC